MIPTWAGDLIGAVIAAIAAAIGEPLAETRARVRMYLAGPLADETDAVGAEIEAARTKAP